MIVIKGLPGSGKSTLANELAKQHNAIILSTDNIISAGDTYLFSPVYLGMAHKLNVAKTKEACIRQLNIIIDNTNTTAKEIQPYYELAKEYNYEFELVEPKTSWANNPGECFRRTTHNVPIDVIRKMSKRYQSNEKVMKQLINNEISPEQKEEIPWNNDLATCIIVDMDGTLAEISHRSPYDTAKCLDDTPNKAVVQALQDSKFDIVVVSGRENKYRELTEQWLQKYNVPYKYLFMRETGDNRKDSVVKREIWENNIKYRYNVWCVYDDRLSVIRECWRSLDFWVFNCNQDMREF